MPLDDVREPASEEPAPEERAAAARERELDGRVQAVVDAEALLAGERGRRMATGLALSGGGVRSATLSLGFLKELSRHGVLDQFDYISSVSGGGYASGYYFGAVAAMKAEVRRSPEARHDELFGAAAVARLREAGHYLNLGTGLKGRFQLVRLIAATLNSAILNVLWLAALFATIAGLLSAGLLAVLQAFGLGQSAEQEILRGALLLLAITPAARAVVLARRGSGREAYRRSWLINNLEGGMLLVGATVLLAVLWWKLHAVINEPVAGLTTWLLGAGLTSPVHQRLAVALVCALGSLLLCFLLTPSAIGLHGVFRERIEAAYFKVKPERRQEPAVALHELTALVRQGQPYPLFNCCVYLRDEPDPEFAGTQIVDYFLLAPGQCGSRLTGYADTRGHYGGMSLAEAVTTSAASVTPGMDGTSTGIASALLWGLNLNLGTWLPNPGQPTSSGLVAWTLQYLRVLRGKLSSSAKLVQVADGGFIDNLGVFELLRRRCRLIIAVDNTYDPHYEFKHLHNLVARARSELGVRLRFRQQPEEVIRPAAGLGFAQAPLVVADIDTLAGVQEPWSGVLVYVKACVLAPSSFKRHTQPSSYRYKAAHPKFPQESTADQFFDRAQWDAYFTLGGHMACRLLGQPRASASELTASDASTRLELKALLARLQSPVAPAVEYR